MTAKKEPTLADLVDALGALRPQQKTEVLVGIRNICGSTVGLPPFAGEPDITLHPWDPSDPNSVAIVNQARWNQIRKSGLFGQGLIERFDEVLDPGVTRAPEDQPQMCHPDHEKNRLPNPREFIENNDEATIRTKIAGITSENQLHHILGTVDRKMKELEAQFRTEGDPHYAKNAIRAIPMRYQAADQAAQARLEQISISNMPEDLKGPKDIR